MAAKKKKNDEVQNDDSLQVEDVAGQLIKQINKDLGSEVAFCLNSESAPTIIKDWVSTGSTQLDYIIKNASGGGYPQGRIIEIAGPPAIGKSHLGFLAARNCQKKGGLVIYIDTENATAIDVLQQLGVNVSKNFVYLNIHCTEEIFQSIENIILKAKSLNKNIPIVVIVDSIAGASPKQELDGEYESSSMGLNARALSKGFRKITGVIGDHNITLICMNHLKEAIGVMYGDKQITPGGSALPYHASVRIRLTSGNVLYDKDKMPIGTHVIATIKKNKCAIPHRKCEFDILFGKGLSEAEYIFDTVREFCTKNKVIASSVDSSGALINVDVSLSGEGAWKSLIVSNVDTGEVLVEKKFYKAEFAKIMQNVEYKPFIDKLIDEAYTKRFSFNEEEVQEIEESEEE